MDKAGDDERLRQRLLLQAAKKQPEGRDLTSYRAAPDRAIETDGFVDSDSMYDYAAHRRNHRCSRGVLKEGHAAEVIELSEHAELSHSAALRAKSQESPTVSGMPRANR